MSFGWNSFGWITLAIDALACALSLGLCAYALRRWDGGQRRVSFLTFKICVRSLVVGFCGWLPAIGFVGGIVGFSLAARLGWTTATVTVPLLCLWLARDRRAPALALAALALVGIKYYGEVWEPANLEVERVQVRLPGLRRTVKLVHLSDLQTDAIGPMQRRVQEAANAFEPDLVLFTGDLINHPSLAGAAGLWLGGFRAPAGKFFVSGDVDSGYDLDGLLERGGFVRLDGQAVSAAGLGLIGVDTWQWHEPGFIARLAAKVAAPRVLLTHQPDAVLTEQPAEFVVAGHTHGGQVCLPFFGPLVTLSRLPRMIAAGGLHRLGKTQLLISRGLGWEGHVAPRVRTFCRPHLLLVELLPERR